LLVLPKSNLREHCINQFAVQPGFETEKNATQLVSDEMIDATVHFLAVPRANASRKNVPSVCDVV